MKLKSPLSVLWQQGQKKPIWIMIFHISDINHFVITGLYNVIYQWKGSRWLNFWSLLQNCASLKKEITYLQYLILSSVRKHLKMVIKCRKLGMFPLWRNCKSVLLTSSENVRQHFNLKIRELTVFRCMLFRNIGDLENINYK